MKNYLVKVRTLSECVDCNKKGLGFIPGFEFLGSVFGQPVIDFLANLFGLGRKRLTSQDWLNIIPGNGALTTQYRNFLASRIVYSDAQLQQNITDKTFNFLVESGRCPFTGYQYRDVPKVSPECLSKFSNDLKSEQGIFAGGFGTGGNMGIYLVGGLLLFFVLGSKKKRGTK